jgi:transposase-like protein
MTTSRLVQYCPFPECPSNRAGRRARIVRHSKLRTRRGVQQRRRCKDCNRTFLASTEGAPSLFSSYMEWTIAHEIGHQLGLPH